MQELCNCSCNHLQEGIVPVAVTQQTGLVISVMLTGGVDAGRGGFIYQGGVRRGSAGAVEVAGLPREEAGHGEGQTDGVEAQQPEAAGDRDEVARDGVASLRRSRTCLSSWQISGAGQQHGKERRRGIEFYRRNGECAAP